MKKIILISLLCIFCVLLYVIIESNSSSTENYLRLPLVTNEKENKKYIRNCRRSGGIPEMFHDASFRYNPDDTNRTLRSSIITGCTGPDGSKIDYTIFPLWSKEIKTFNNIVICKSLGGKTNPGLYECEFPSKIFGKIQRSLYEANISFNNYLLRLVVYGIRYYVIIGIVLISVILILKKAGDKIKK